MQSAEVEEQSASPLYPIREVSRLTGVNTVTLRAWERRYGLICPQRTPKGHRLYSAEDIETIRRVLQWLDKGVAVSQVGELLDKTPHSPLQLSTEGEWEAVTQEFKRHLEQQDEELLDQLYNTLFANWTGHQLVERLLKPLVSQLPEHSIQAAFLARFLRNRVGTRLHQSAATAAGPKILLVQTQATGSINWPLLLALQSLVDLDFQVFWLDSAISQQAAYELIERQRPRLVFITQSQPETTAGLASFCDTHNLPLVTLDANQGLQQLEEVSSQTLHQLLQKNDSGD